MVATQVNLDRLPVIVVEIADATGDDLSAVADMLASDMPRKQLVRLAAGRLADLASAHRRAMTLEAERNAQSEREARIRGAEERFRRNEPMDDREAQQFERRRTLDQQHYERMAAIEHETAVKINAIMETYKRTLRMQWTQELLDSYISMPDGSTVTWGDATVEQHRRRLDMFMSNAKANVEGAARHQEAIDQLQRAGLSTLRELAERQGRP